MKKTKLVLLTILIILVLYCGAVIFVTKPDSFAYTALFSGVVTVPSSEQKVADEPDAESQVVYPQVAYPQVDMDAISAEIEAVSTQKANDAISAAADNTDAAVRAAVDAYTEEIKALIKSAVEEALADVEVPAAELSDAAAIELYMKYRDAIVEDLASAIRPEAAEPAAEIPAAEVPAVEAPAVEAAEEAPEVITMSQEEYEAVRQEIRDAEIGSLLDLLQI